MAIHEVTTTDVLQHCEACDDEHRVLIDDLEVGVAHDQQVDGRLVPMPPCPVCGAVEFLVRAPDNEPEHPSQGSFGHLHRMMVDELHAELITRDKVNTALRDGEGNVPPSLAKPLSTEKRDRWFSKGLRARRKVEQAERTSEETLQ
jgi:hypothetical protein